MEKILVADDSAIIRAGLKQRIQKIGYRVLLAKDGGEAWEVIRKEKVSLALLDQNMPVLTGMEVLKKIRTDKEFHSLPVIFFTGQSKLEEKEAAFSCGANDYIVKTTDDAELEMRIRTHLHHYRVNESLHQFEFMSNTSRDHMYMVDRNYIYCAVNDAYARDYNKKRDEIIGCHLSDVSGEEVFLKTIKPALDSCFDGEEVKYQEEVVSPILGHRDMEVFYYPYQPNGKITAVVVISHDVTDRKMAEAELLEARSVSSMSRMTASIAHEMRQPLTAVDIYLEETVNDLKDDNLRKILNLARSCNQEALLIIRTMMKAFRGNRKRTVSDVDINRELKETLSLFGRKAKGVDIVYDLAKDARVMTTGNLSRIFINLISNALGALNNKGQLKLTTRANCNNIEVFVEDNGPGIPKENLHKIFNPEFTTKNSGEGTGLGLWIAMQEAERSSSRITVESHEEKFTRFKVLIPFNQEKSG